MRFKICFKCCPDSYIASKHINGLFSSQRRSRASYNGRERLHLYCRCCAKTKPLCVRACVCRYLHLLRTFFCYSLTRGRACGWQERKKRNQHIEHERENLFGYHCTREDCPTRMQHTQRTTSLSVDDIETHEGA